MKLIAIDLDGTLLNSNHEISTTDINMLNKSIDLGITIIVSTGRTFESAKEILLKHNLQVPYIITCNGAIINDYDGNILYSFPVDKYSMEKVISFLYYNNYYFSLSTKTSRIFLKNSKNLLMSDFYLAKGKYLTLKESDLDYLINLFYSESTFTGLVLDNFSDFLSIQDDIYGVCAVSFNKDKLSYGLNALKDVENLSIFKSAFNNFELINENSSKGAAIKILAKDLDISLDQTMAIGDNENDISMFKTVSFSVAMGNSKKEIKDFCTFITLDNNSSGVSYAIESMLALRV